MLILVLEMVTEHKVFAPLHIAFVLVVVGVVYLITLQDPRRSLDQVRHPLDWVRQRAHKSQDIAPAGVDQ